MWIIGVISLSVAFVIILVNRKKEERDRSVNRTDDASCHEIINDSNSSIPLRDRDSSDLKTHYDELTTNEAVDTTNAMSMEPVINQDVEAAQSAIESSSTIHSDINDSEATSEGTIVGTTNSKTPLVNSSLPTNSSASDGENKTIKMTQSFRNYKPVPLTILARDPHFNPEANEKLRKNAETLQDTLKKFDVIDARVVNISHGPAVTTYEVIVGQDVKAARLRSLEEDIAYAMAATTVRIEVPVPGKNKVGIEISNEKVSTVHLGSILDTREFRGSSPMTIALGRNTVGRPLYCDLTKMPHLLVSGLSGSGKSVCVDSILMSILCKSSPQDVRMILIDKKPVGLSIYAGIPHLIMPVVSEDNQVLMVLKWILLEIDRRNRLIASKCARNIDGYNVSLDDDEAPLPLILVVIDEIADVIKNDRSNMDNLLARIISSGRACGIHLVVTTNRLTNEIMGLPMVSMIPSRLSFRVGSKAESKMVLDASGAEEIHRVGDFLFKPMGCPKPIRGHGAYVSDVEIAEAIHFLRQRYGSLYCDDIREQIRKLERENQREVDKSRNGKAYLDDELLTRAVEVVLQSKNASVSVLQRRLGVNYPEAAKLIDKMEEKGYIGSFEGSKPRRVLITEAEWSEKKSRGDI